MAREGLMDDTGYDFREVYSLPCDGITVYDIEEEVFTCPHATVMADENGKFWECTYSGWSYGKCDYE